jgi:hypothetical protein
MSLTKVTYSMIDGIAVNVNDFGAVGDGSTDDTVAIQAAIDSLPTEGGTLYFPNGGGNYLISETIEITGDNITVELNNQTVSFDAGFTKNGAPDYGIYNVMFAVLGENVTVQNGIFKQGAFTDSSVFLWFGVASQQCKAINNKFYDIPYVIDGGVYGVLLGVAIQTRTGSTNNQVLNCSFYNCAGAVSMQGTHGLIDGCYSYTDVNQVTGLPGSVDQPFGIDGSNFCAITNCKVFRTSTAPIAGANIGANTTTSNFIISNNLIEGVKAGVGLFIRESDYGEVTNNVISGSDYATTGAWALARIDVDSSLINFANNILRAAPIGFLGRGLDVSTGYNTVSNNQFLFGAAASVFSCVAIQENTSPQTIKIEDNLFVAASIGVYLDGVTTNSSKTIILTGNDYNGVITTPYSSTSSLDINAPLWISNEKFSSASITTFAINTHKLFRPFNTYGAWKFPVNTAQNLVYYAGEVPSSPNYDDATYAVGDTVWNSAPAVGSPIGWKCTVAGTFDTGSPPTFVAMANL